MENVKFFENGLYKTDNKELFKMVDGKYYLVTKTRKNIYSIITNNKTYVMDSFGDCYELNDDLKFIFGILSNPLFFGIKNDRIYALDRYSRMWICNLKGEIIKIVFLKENIFKVNLEKCYYITDNKKNVVSYEDFTTDMRDLDFNKEGKLNICDEDFNIVKSYYYNKIIKIEENYCVLEIEGKNKNVNFLIN